MTLGDVIKLLRTEQNLTQPELADKARIEQSYLSKLENDKATPSFDIINRLAQALGLTGMGLIHKLSHSYISENLSHLPEVAAEYATVKEKRERSSKRQLLCAAALVLIGTASALTGTMELMASNTTWYYASDGVLKEGEHYKQFDQAPINEIRETREEWEARLQHNRTRIDRSYIGSSTNRGSDFIDKSVAGRRFYRLENREYTSQPANMVMQILGVLSGLSGVMLAAYSIWKYRRH